ncbi:Hypothetical protein SRAE_1000256100 [Strongyloides ratti]|uniref:Uncharacterized protein n=1 Tax=Strongyloides ratti TaxID=34506 RepID=A0A090L3C4_STRRB|nr:Hypothetical protein SRAE_1000256100 [Strongyloides ratti]CEF64306.1 Hypothetical protein SRAE_1000256100 [Strongyloides ratti]
MSFVRLPGEDMHNFINMLTGEERLELENIYSEMNKSYPERIYELIFSIYPQFRLLFLVCLFQRILISYGKKVLLDIIYF